MDWQKLFDLAFAGLLALGGILMKSIRTDITDLRKGQESLHDRITKTQVEYLQKDEYREDLREIKEVLTRIDTKLDGKADK